MLPTVDETRTSDTSSQALLAELARRAGAARAIGAVFAGLSLLAVGSTLAIGGTAVVASALVLAASTSAFACAWWLARDPSRATLSGSLIVGAALTQHVLSSAVILDLTSAVHISYFTALSPLVAAVTLRAGGVAVTGAAGALALGVQIALGQRFGQSAWQSFVSPCFYFVSTWIVAILSALASQRALRAHAKQEQHARAASDVAREAQARYEFVAEHVSDLIALFDGEGRYLYASPSFSRVLGTEPAALLGRASPELVHDEDLAKLQSAFTRARAEGVASGLARLRTAAGEFRWFHVGFSRVSAVEADGAGELAVAVSARDVTEQQELSEALEKNRRMEALGSLAGGVAHDFNNLLMVIQSCTDLASSQLPSDHAAQADLADVSQAVKRASALTQQLLTFARRQVVPPTESAVVAQTVNELSPILARLCGKNVAFSLRAHDSVRAVDLSAVQLEQLVMNLAANACDAMAGGGRLSIEVRDRTLGADEVPGLEPGPYVELEVTDTGAGIAPAIQERIFEPFFTTKPAGKGTGLGLATVFGLVSQLHGHIGVRSALGAGATFTVLLPESRRGRSTRSVAAQPVELGAVLAPLAVLVVDDEAAVRTSIARILDKAGHHVTEADAVDGALVAATVPGARFDAIITDVVIGSGDGINMLERLRAAQPDAAVVVMSGFNPSPERVASLAEHGAEFLPKPFAAPALLAALSRARARGAADAVTPS